jgi:hypothetical protein
MSITTSLDWEKESDRLMNFMSSSGYNPDLKKVYNNINGMITDLSKLEVEARRTHNNLKVEECLIKINEAIDRLEKLLLIAKLIS